MTVAQLEHAPTFTDPLPAQDTLERMKELCRHHDSEEALAADRREILEWYESREATPPAEQRAKIVNQLTQCELRKRQIEDEIINVARLLVAEADNAEMATE